MHTDIRKLPHCYRGETFTSTKKIQGGVATSVAPSNLIT